MLDGSVKLLQGVREVFELLDSADTSGAAREDGGGEGKIVLIGRDIERDALQRGLLESVVGGGV